MAEEHCFALWYASYLGPVPAVLHRFKTELACSPRYHIQFDLSKCTLYCLAGDKFEGDVREFVTMGVTICWRPHIEILKTILVGNDEFVKEWRETKCKKLNTVIDAIA